MSYVHGSTAGKLVIEPDVCARESTAGHSSACVHSLDQTLVELSEKAVPCGVEAVVACFDQHRGVWSAEQLMMKERVCLLRVGNRRFLEQHVFPSFERGKGPFVVQTIGQWVVYTVNGWVTDKCYGVLVSRWY